MTDFSTAVLAVAAWILAGGHLSFGGYEVGPITVGTVTEWWCLFGTTRVEQEEVETHYTGNKRSNDTSAAGAAMAFVLRVGVDKALECVETAKILAKREAIEEATRRARAEQSGVLAQVVSLFALLDLAERSKDAREVLTYIEIATDESIRIRDALAAASRRAIAIARATEALPSAKAELS